MNLDKTKIAVDVFNKYSKEYMDKFMDVSLYHSTFDVFCNLINNNDATILELACGPGNITKYILDKKPNYKLLGTDLAPNMLELAKQNNPNAQFQLLDAKNILQLKQRFDAIMCGFCFPYFSKEEAINFIKDAYSILNPNGVLYISTMEDDYFKSGFKKGSKGDEIFMHFHEANYLSDALKEHKFQLTELKRITTTNDDGSETVDLILIAVK